MIFQLDGTPPGIPFPDPSLAETDPDGLLAVGGDLSVERLVNAYRTGIFPWYSEGQPILWWSPDPRTVLYPEHIHIARSLKRQMRAAPLDFRLDTAFAQVTSACAAPRAHQDGTWLLPEMRAAYQALHKAGIAHSAELWQGDRLVGGMYGLAIGGVFFGESMFSRITSASRMVMVVLSQLLLKHRYRMLDCQVYNPHLERMGAVEIERGHFLATLRDTVALPEPDLWAHAKDIRIDVREVIA